jgi:hypothetical protein
VLNKLVVASSSSGGVVSGRNPAADSSSDCVSTGRALPIDDDDSLGKSDTSERLDDGGGGVSSEGVKRGMVLMRFPEENNSVRRRKDVSPDVSCSGMEPTDGEGARMDDSYVPLDPRPQLCRLDSAREGGVRYEDVDVSKVSGMLLSSDGACHVVDGGPEPIGEPSARLRNPNPGLLRISLERVSRDGPARVVPVPVPVPPVPLGV